MTNHSSPQAARELLVFRFLRALDEGDEWTLETLLDSVESDEESHLLSEVQLAWLEEQGLKPLPGAALAVELAQKHLSPPPLACGELNVDEVAGFLLLQGAPESEKEALSLLSRLRIPVPGLLSRANLELLARQLGIAADFRFWRRFKDAAITLRMQRTTPQSQLALAREAERPKKPASPMPATKPEAGEETP